MTQTRLSLLLYKLHFFVNKFLRKGRRRGYTQAQFVMSLNQVKLHSSGPITSKMKDDDDDLVLGTLVAMVTGLDINVVLISEGSSDSQIQSINTFNFSKIHLQSNTRSKVQIKQ